jgi:hypothetical protein
VKVLAAKVEWHDGFCNDPNLKILVDHMPKHDGPIWHAEKLGSKTFCWSVEQGSVRYFYHDPRDQEGFGGRVFKITLKDGTEQEYKGPWSSNAQFAQKYVGEYICHVSMTDDQKAWERGYTFYAADVTLDIALWAAEKAGVDMIPVGRSSGDGVLSGEQVTGVEHGLNPRESEVSHVPCARGKQPKWIQYPGEPMKDHWRHPEVYRVV